MLYQFSQLILRNFEGKIYLFGIMCFSLDGSYKLLNFMVFFMTTVLFSAQFCLLCWRSVNNFNFVK